jgi:hypothetical protein
MRDLRAAPRQLLTIGACTAPLLPVADELPDARQQRIDLRLTSPHGETVARRLTGRTGAIAGQLAHTGEPAGATPSART